MWQLLRSIPDIKPSNILLCRNGQVKLCDFGVSGEFGTKGDANTFIGTSYYMAPERITGQSYTITSDVWSLGVTLLEVAQHRFPFPADGTEMQPKAGLIDLLTYIVRQPIPTLKDEPEHRITWSGSFKYFIECWYVSALLILSVAAFNSLWRNALTSFPVLKKKPRAAPLRGGCLNIRGWSRCRARKSTWSISWHRCGTGKTEAGLETKARPSPLSIPIPLIPSSPITVMFSAAIPIYWLNSTQVSQIYHGCFPLTSTDRGFVFAM